MPKLYLFEIASALIGVLLLVVDCHHMMMDPPDASQFTAVQRPPDMQYLFSAQGAQVQRTDVIKELNDLSMLASAGAARAQSLAQ